MLSFYAILLCYPFYMTPEEIFKKSVKKIKPKTKAESLAQLEEDLFKATQEGDTKKQKQIKAIIKRIKNLK